MSLQAKVYNITSDGNIDIGQVFGKFSINILFNSGSGTISIQGSHTDSDYIEFPESATYTDSALLNLEWSGYLRFNLSGSSSADIDISLLPYK